MRIRFKRRRSSVRTAAAAACILASLVLGAPSHAPQAAYAESSKSIREEINKITSEVNDRRNEAEELSGQVERYRELVLSTKLETANLKDQLGLLETRAAKTELGIEIAEKEIHVLELQIESTDERMAKLESRMERERELLASLARHLYRRQSGGSVLEIVLANDSFSDFFADLYSIAALQESLDKTIDSIVNLRVALEEERRLREERLAAFNKKRLALEAERRKLEDEQALRENLLVETRASELEYRYMLAELKREQNEADAEIAYLERVLREKIDLSDRLDNERVTTLSWPVDPSRGVTATFHDPDYPYRHIFEHPGIDVRAYQSTQVRAAASGVVARAKNAGMGYSYVMIIHNNDISTVYGHLSSISVKEDTFVERGEIIGLSGGMPGTRGAGSLTTGPHLHFESRLRGIPVDPMAYLPGR